MTTEQIQPKQERVSVTLAELTPEEHGQIICYPGTDLSSFESRVAQLTKNGVTQLVLEGASKIGKYGIVGRGCVSVVLKARLESESELVALKIRRVDANRSDMARDYELQKLANSFGVGPRAIFATKDLFAMEYIDAMKIGKWFQQLKTRTSKKYLRRLIRKSLEQCYSLDTNGLDHGELSNPSKHILIRKGTPEPDTVIIDFESASTQRRAANLTSVAQFFLLAGGQSEKVRKILGASKTRKELSKQKIISLLKNYKQDPCQESFDSLMEYIGC